MSHRRSRRTRHAVLSGLCLLLALPLMLTRMHTPSPLPVQQTGTVTAVPQTPPPSPLTDRPLEHYTGIVERPLFSRTRRPLETATPAADAPPPPTAPTTAPDFQLSAVILDGSKRIALLRPSSAAKSNDEPRHVTLGDSYQGWDVTEVGRHMIRVERGGQKHILELQRTPQSPPRPSTPAATPTPPPTAPARDTADPGLSQDDNE